VFDVTEAFDRATPIGTALLPGLELQVGLHTHNGNDRTFSAWRRRSPHL
jgi:hypothetical protein